MYTELMKPWAILGLTLLVVAGAALRVTEHRLPRLAEGIRDEVEERVRLAEQTIPLQEIPDADNAAVLYDRAARLMNIPEDAFGGIYRNGELLTRWWVVPKGSTEEYGLHSNSNLALPGNTTAFPPALRAQIDEMLARHAGALELLRRAATLPGSYWRIEEFNRNVPFWGASRTNLAGLMLFDILAHVLDGNETDAMVAFEAIAAFGRALDAVDAPLGYYSQGPYRRCATALSVLIGYGIETDLFSDASLARLDVLFTYRNKPNEQLLKHLSRYDSAPRFDTVAYHEQMRLRRQDSAIFGVGKGTLWYLDRMYALGTRNAILTGNLMQHGMMRLDAFHNIEDVQREHDAMGIAALYAGTVLFDPFVDRPAMSLEYLSDLYYVLLYGELYEAETLARLRFHIAMERYRRDTGTFPKDATTLSPRYLPESLVAPIAAGDWQYTRTDAGWTVRKHTRRGKSYVFMRFPLDASDEQLAG